MTKYEFVFTYKGHTEYPIAHGYTREEAKDLVITALKDKYDLTETEVLKHLRKLESF